MFLPLSIKVDVHSGMSPGTSPVSSPSLQVTVNESLAQTQDDGQASSVLTEENNKHNTAA